MLNTFHSREKTTSPSQSLIIPSCHQNSESSLPPSERLESPLATVSHNSPKDDGFIYTIIKIYWLKWNILSVISFILVKILDCVIIGIISLFLRHEFSVEIISALPSGQGAGDGSWRSLRIQPMKKKGDKWRSLFCPYLCRLTLVDDRGHCDSITGIRYMVSCNPWGQELWLVSLSSWHLAYIRCSSNLSSIQFKPNAVFCSCFFWVEDLSHHVCPGPCISSVRDQRKL